MDSNEIIALFFIVLAVILVSMPYWARPATEAFCFLFTKHSFERDDYFFYEFDEEIHRCTQCGKEKVSRLTTKNKLS